MIKVNEQYCPQNHKCPAQHHCPAGAIEQKNAFSAPTINKEKCTDCGLCTRVCHVFRKA
ncbi:MAG: 4Fe-4S binding protein [Candidatus Cloacimonadales bacterium]|nr:4Fe-4S binding protein [Candidatus Cloacimonadales bacterium]